MVIRVLYDWISKTKLIIWHIFILKGFPVICGSAGKQSSCNAETWVGTTSWKRDRLPTPVFWPGEFHGLYSPWGRKEWDMTERLTTLIRSKAICENCTGIKKQT